MTATLLKSLNDYVRKFLDENEVDQESWNSDENQATLKKLVGKVGAKTASAKAAKDPNAPKHFKSAYIFFCQDYRGKSKQELGDDAKTTEITAHLGEMWKTMKTDKKRAKELEKYNRLAAEDKARYQREFSDYTPSEGFKKKRSKKAAAADGPKKPLSAYIYFSNEYRAQAKEELGEGTGVTDVAKRLGEMWRELKEDESRADELDRFNQLAAKDKARYEGEKASNGDVKPKKGAAKPAAAPAKSKPVAKPAAKPKASAPAKPKASAPKPAGKGKGGGKAPAKPKKQVQLEEEEEDIVDE